MKLKDMFYVEEKDWHMLQAWAGLAYSEDKNEISGLMTAIPQENNRYKLSNVEILKQENSGASTELDADAVAEYKMKYAMRYKNKNMKFVWWHSHHTMSAFWSGTDLKEIDAWKNSSFSLALVINLKEEYVFRVSVWNASGIPIAQHYDIPLEINRKSRPKITDKMKTLYKELCEDDSYVRTANTHVNGRVWNGSSFQTNLLSSKNEEIDLFNYKRIKQKVESLMEEFMSSALPFKDFKEGLNKLRKECNTKKFNFRVCKCNYDKQAAINELQHAFPDDLFEFDDNEIAIEYQYPRDNDGWGYGGYGV